ncbi:putative cysteine synthase [Phaeomoniella chlamydospora]|uniref:Putative cysteine synthase n=1 Tax=Phaeomoniella chlamydospora TaxID=158046 RepID=A0A0G2E0Z3_PHACM|nr:putative cysteine synthase [Phaeomoniella chlamydospora]
MVVLYGGPAQPEISDPRGQIQKLKQLGQDRQDIYNPGQYENLANPAAHDRWTGPQLLKQLPEINIFCTGMGSAGCVTGTGRFLKKHKPSATVIGVCNSLGDAIPGPRPLSLFDKIAFPWKQVTDAVQEVNSADSYRLSMAMSREGIICGPSSGMALKGLFGFLQQQKDLGRLEDYAEPGTEEVSCVFLCCDLPYQYLDTYFEKLDKSDFDPISNSQLANIDQGTYDPAWELSGVDIMNINQGKPFVLGAGEEPLELASKNNAPAAVLDLRQPGDFASSHITGSLNLALPSLHVETPSPFDQVPILETQFKEIRDILSDPDLLIRLHRAKCVLVVCYTGETARLACSAMRCIDIEAYSVRGGFHSLEYQCSA